MNPEFPHDDKIPEAVIRRLPKYYRYLQEMSRRNESRISSSKMSRDMGLNASQIRRDLNCFGGFGQQGYGYSVSKLLEEVSKILGIDRRYGVVIVGAGNIGQALIRYSKFIEQGFDIKGVFDIDQKKVGSLMDSFVVQHVDTLDTFAHKTNVDIGIICVPRIAAQQTADMLVMAGVEGVWNFAPIDVQARKGVSVENVHLNDSLYVLCYRMTEGDRLPPL